MSTKSVCLSGRSQLVSGERLQPHLADSTRCTSSFVVASLVLLATTARAADPSPPTARQVAFSRAVQLDYRPAPGCPDEQAFRDVVAAQMKGADPFAASGARRMTVTLTRRSRDYQGVIALFADTGKPAGIREIAGATCGAVIEDIATSISIALQPSAPPAAASPVVAPPPPPAASNESSPPSPPTISPWPMIRLSAGAQLAGGIAPSLAVGFIGGAGIRWSRLSLSLEGRADLPSSSALPLGGTVRTSFLGGTFAPCFHEQWFLVCGVLTAGRVLGSTSAESTSDANSAAYAGIGPRLGGEYFFTPHLGAQLVGDVLVGLARPGIRIGGVEAWSAAVVSESVSLRLVATF